MLAELEASTSHDPDQSGPGSTDLACVRATASRPRARGRGDAMMVERLTYAQAVKRWDAAAAVVERIEEELRGARSGSCGSPLRRDASRLA